MFSLSTESSITSIHPSEKLQMFLIFPLLTSRRIAFTMLIFWLTVTSMPMLDAMFL